MATKYKRGGIWWARAQRDGKEFRQSLKTGDRRVAEKRLAEWIENLETVAWSGRPRVSFREAVKQFVQHHFPTLKPKAAQRYGVSLKWLGDVFGGMYIDQISRKHLAEFEDARRRMAVRNKPEARVSSPTIRRDLSCLSSVLTFCEDREWLDDGRNPVPGYLRRRARRGLKEAPGRTRYLSEAEESSLLSKAGYHLRMALMVAIDTGLREQELFSLRWPQIDFRRSVIVTTDDTKSGRRRQVPLAQRSAQALEQHRAAQGVTVRSIYVFAHDDGSRRRNMAKAFKTATAKAGIADIRWHDLRRTAGCRWRQRDGVSLEQVSILLGHSSYAVTEKSYAFLENSKVAEAVAAQFPAQVPVQETK